MSNTKVLPSKMTDEEIVQRVVKKLYDWDLELLNKEQIAKGERETAHMYGERNEKVVGVVRQGKYKDKVGTQGQWGDWGIDIKEDGKIHFVYDEHCFGFGAENEVKIKEMQQEIEVEYGKEECERYAANLNGVLAQDWQTTISIDPVDGTPKEFQEMAIDITSKDWEKLKGDPVMQNIQLA